MDTNQKKINWQGEVVSIQPRSTVWRYLIDNRTHNEIGFNVFIKGSAYSGPEELVTNSGTDKYDYCVAISEKQAFKIRVHIGDILKGTAWTKKYPEIEFADYYRAGSIIKIKGNDTSASVAMDIKIDEKNTTYDGIPIPRVDSSEYPGPPWMIEVPPLEIYSWRGQRMLSRSSWKGKCFKCIWANMANVTVQYDFNRNLVKNRFETFCYGPLSCKYYKMGPARTVPYKGMSGIKDQGWLDEICVQFRKSFDE